MSTDRHQIDFLARQGVFALALGRELARARRAQQRDRSTLAGEAGLSVQSIACYEQGTRGLSLGRFVLLCLLLSQYPEQVLCRAMQHTLRRGDEDALCVDLTVLAETVEPCLRPVSRWASVRLRQYSAGSAAVTELDSAAMAAMAAVASTSPEHLKQALTRAGAVTATRDGSRT